MRRRDDVPELVAERERLHAEFDALVLDQLARRRPVPCVEAAEPVRSWWTSDDPAEQAKASARCLDCAAFYACRALIERLPDERGVYGGSTDAERRRGPGRPRKDDNPRPSERTDQ